MKDNRKNVNCIIQTNGKAISVSMEDSVTLRELLYFLDQKKLITITNYKQLESEWIAARDEKGGFCSCDTTIRKLYWLPHEILYVRHPLTFTVYCWYAYTKYTLRLPETYSAYGVYSYMRAKHGVPDGLLIALSSRPPHHPLPDYVYDGLELVIDSFDYYFRNDDERPMELLYGCPNANHMLGDVPECMLAAFKGFEVREIV